MEYEQDNAESSELLMLVLCELGTSLKKSMPKAMKFIGTKKNTYTAEW